MDPTKGWLPEGTTQGDLDDGDFAWLSDAYKRGDEPKSSGRKLPYKIHSKVNEAGWKAAWSRAHSMADGDFDGGPSRTAVIAKLKKDKPAGVDISDDGKALLGGREYKTFGFKVGDTAGLQENEFCGYVAALSNLDDGGDVILPGAFAATLSEFLASGVICWQHDWSTPIGKPLLAHEDPYGLFIKAAVSLTTAGKDALILMRDGVVKRMSIGYEVQGYRMLSDDEGIAMFGQAAYDAALRKMPWYQDGIRALTQIKLYEGSPVSVPMNPKAIITGVKELGALAALTHDAHFAAVHAAVEEYLSRVKSIMAIRAESRRGKAGRMLSAANAGKLQTMRDSLAEHMAMLDDMLAANSPSADPDDDGDTETGGESMGQSAALAAARAAARHELLRAQRLLAVAQGA